MEAINSFNYQYCRIAKLDNIGYGFFMDQGRDADRLLQENLKRIIKERFGDNQAEFSRQLGFNPTYINAVVRGKKNLGKPNWEKIRKALNLRPDEFLHGQSTPMVQDEEEQKMIEWFRSIRAAGMIKEAKAMMEYLSNSAKKSSAPATKQSLHGKLEKLAQRRRRKKSA